MEPSDVESEGNDGRESPTQIEGTDSEEMSLYDNIANIADNIDIC